MSRISSNSAFSNTSSFRQPVRALSDAASKPMGVVYVDDLELLTGDRVLFTGLNGAEASDNNKVFRAYVFAGEIQGWNLDVDGRYPDGAPKDGDLLVVQEGTVNADKVQRFTGTAWTETGGGGAAGIYVSKTGDTMSGLLALPTNGLSVGTNQLYYSNSQLHINTVSRFSQDTYIADRKKLIFYPQNNTIGEFGGMYWGAEAPFENYYAAAIIAERMVVNGTVADLVFKVNIDNSFPPTEALRIKSSTDVAITGRSLILSSLASDPLTDLYAGQLYYNTTAGNLKYYTGSVWVELDQTAPGEPDGTSMGAAGVIQYSDGADGFLGDGNFSWDDAVSRLNITGSLSISGNILPATNGSASIGSPSLLIGSVSAQSIGINNIYNSTQGGPGGIVNVYAAFNHNNQNISGVAALTASTTNIGSGRFTVGANISMKSPVMITQQDSFNISYLGFSNTTNTAYIGQDNNGLANILPDGFIIVTTGSNKPIGFGTSNALRLRINDTVMLPGVNNNFALGSFSQYFSNINAAAYRAVGATGGEYVVMDTGGTGYVRLAANLTLPSGATGGAGIHNQNAASRLAFYTNNTSVTLPINIETGNASAGASGDIVIRTGTATTTRGTISLIAATTILTGDILPVTTNAGNIGSSSFRFDNVYTGAVRSSGVIQGGSLDVAGFNVTSGTIPTGADIFHIRLTSYLPIITPNTTSANNSNPLELQTGNTDTGTSGNILLRIGTTSGGSRGTINFVDASLVTAAVGYVWTLTNLTTGAGNWATAGGGAGANTSLSNLTATSISQSLVPANATSPSLGSSANRWLELFVTQANVTEQINIGATAGIIGYFGAGFSILNNRGTGSAVDRQIEVYTKNVGDASVASGLIKLTTGNNTTGPSGSITLTTGTNGGGLRGTITLDAPTITIAGNLAPDTFNGRLLGTSSKVWVESWVSTYKLHESGSARGNLGHGAVTPSGTTSTIYLNQIGALNPLCFFTENFTVGASQTAPIRIETGNQTATGNSGGIFLRTGTSTVTRGSIFFDEVSISSAVLGYVWTIQDIATGRGAWAAAGGGGANTSLSNLVAPTAVSESLLMAATKFVRVPNNIAFKARNAGNTADVDLIRLSGGNTINLGAFGVAVLPADSSQALGSTAQPWATITTMADLQLRTSGSSDSVVMTGANAQTSPSGLSASRHIRTAQLGDSFLIWTGSGNSAGGATTNGQIRLETGTNTTTGAGFSGDIALQTGNVSTGTGAATTGAISLTTGNASGTTTSGNINLVTGAGGTRGTINFNGSNYNFTANANARIVPSATNTMELGTTSQQFLRAVALRHFSDFVSGSSYNSGFGLVTGNGQGYTGSGMWDSGTDYANPFFVYTFNEATADAVQTKGVSIITGNKTAGTGNSGDITLQTGTSVGGLRGRVSILAKTLGLPTAAADPASPIAGDAYYNTVSNKIKFYNGTAWETVTST